MKRNLVLFLLLLYGTNSFANVCNCRAIPESKTYSQARQKNFLGYTVAWTCKYQCVVLDKTNKIITKDYVIGSYKEHYFRKENGTEGICESMDYSESKYIEFMNDIIYYWNGKYTDLSPIDSDAAELNKWGKDQDCE